MIKMTELTEGCADGVESHPVELDRRTTGALN